MRILISLLLAAGLWQSPALAAVDEDNFTRCASIALQEDRLRCFDQMAEEYAIPVGEARLSEANERSKWILNDSLPERISVSLTADTVPSAAPPDNLPVLSIACAEGELEVAIDWKTYLGGKNELLIRMGERDAMQADWRREAGDQITILPEGAADFVRELRAVDRLLAQTVPFGEDPVTAVFDVRGLDSALVPVQQACNP